MKKYIAEFTECVLVDLNHNRAAWHCGKRSTLPEVPISDVALLSCQALELGFGRI